MTKVSRTLDVYSIHGHESAGSAAEQLLDYVSFFDQLSQRGVGVSFQVGQDTVALTDKAVRGSRVAFRFVTGNAEDFAESFDIASGTTQQVDLGGERFIVRGAWVIIDPVERFAVIERKRPGVPVVQLERFLSSFGRDFAGLPALTVSLNPVPSSSFIREIDRFSRIREASVTIRRPNNSFTAAAQQTIAQIAAESNAGTATVQVNAERGQSLTKSDGIVQDIRTFVQRPISPVTNARISGDQPGFDGERSVSLNKHTVRGTAKIESTDAPLKQLDILDGPAESLIDDAATAQLEASDSADDLADLTPSGSPAGEDEAPLALEPPAEKEPDE